MDKTYTQAEVDDICAKIKAKSKEKHDSIVANDYVSKTDYASLQAENKQLRNQVIQPKLEQALMSAGCKKECVADCLQLNKGLYECKEEDIKYNIQKCREERPYMFNNEFSAETGNQTDPEREAQTDDSIKTATGTIIVRNR